MKTTVGHLIASLFHRYEHELGDEHLAAIATQRRVNAALLRRALDEDDHRAASKS